MTKQAATKGQVVADQNSCDMYELELSEMSRRGKARLQELNDRVTRIGNTGSDSTAQRHFFEENGFLLLPGFASPENCCAMQHQMKEWVDNQWDAPFADEGKHEKDIAVFRTDAKQESAQGSNAYFLESASKIHFFAEQGAMSKDNYLRDEFRDNKWGALNKAGHGLHCVPNSPFFEYTKSAKVQRLVQDTLGYVDPVIPQSMYIFKQPRVGSEVTSHQDSTFLYTTPRQTCLGLWLALDDTTLTNGCLWVRPGSHREPLRRKFVRNEEHFGEKVEGISGDTSKPLMVFQSLSPEESELENTAPWEGNLPAESWPPPCKGLWEAGFVPLECKAGDLVVFPGTLDHLSLPNYSSKQRHTFQLHLVEGPRAGITWAGSNWLQYPEGQGFLSIARTAEYEKKD
jgi:phytanoyl-CoA hydroxylase